MKYEAVDSFVLKLLKNFNKIIQIMKKDKFIFIYICQIIPI